MSDKKRSKYRVGMVVKMLRSESFAYCRITRKAPGDGWWMLRHGNLTFPVSERRFRPLTVREKGKD